MDQNPLKKEWFDAIHNADGLRVQRLKQECACLRDENDFTALMILAGINCPAHLELLQELQGSEVGVQNREGMSALMVAAMVDNMEAIRVLGPKEAGLVMPGSGYSAWSWAVLCGNVNAQRFLEREYEGQEMVQSYKRLKKTSIPAEVAQSLKELRENAQKDAQRTMEARSKPQETHGRSSAALRVDDFPTLQETDFTANDLAAVDKVALLNDTQFVLLQQAEEQLKALFQGISTAAFQVKDRAVREVLEAKYGTMLTGQLLL